MFACQQRSCSRLRITYKKPYAHCRLLLELPSQRWCESAFPEGSCTKCGESSRFVSQLWKSVPLVRVVFLLLTNIAVVPGLSHGWTTWSWVSAFLLRIPRSSAIGYHLVCEWKWVKIWIRNGTFNFQITSKRIIYLYDRCWVTKDGRFTFAFLADLPLTSFLIYQKNLNSWRFIVLWESNKQTFLWSYDRFGESSFQSHETYGSIVSSTVTTYWWVLEVGCTLGGHVRWDIELLFKYFISF